MKSVILAVFMVLSLLLILVACESENECPPPPDSEDQLELESKISDLEKQLITDYNACEAKILEQETTIASLEWKLEQAVKAKSEPTSSPTPDQPAATPNESCPECPECPDCPKCPPCPTATPLPSPSPTPIPSPSPQPEPGPTISGSPFAKTISNALEYLAGPGIEYAELGNFDTQEELFVVGQYNDCRWLKVTTQDGDTGWILSQNAFLQHIDPIDSCEAIPIGTYNPFTYVIHSDISDNGRGRFTLTNHLDTDIVLVLLDPENGEYFAAYVRSGDSVFQRNIENGNYKFYYTTGLEWDDIQKEFTQQVTYMRFWFVPSFTTTADSYTVMNIDLIYGEEGQLPGSSIGADKFPEL